MQKDLVIELGKKGSDPTLAYLAVLLSVIATVFGVIISWVITSYVSLCLSHQHRAITNMTKGNFVFKLKRKHNDDFGLIMSDLESMRASLNKVLTEVKENSDATEVSLKEVIAKSEVISNQVVDCEDKSVTVSAASEQMLSTTQDIAKNCEDASSLSEATKSVIDDGVQRIKYTIDAIRSQSAEMESNSKAVEKVAKRSLDINSIVNTIEEIAAQTNLLALNAAIEAARAGEAGRGFAVVADEVRALASRTSASTKEIATMVADIQKDAATASESMNTSVESMEETSNETAAVESAMREMIEHVNQVNMQITQIASAAEEQSTATSEISHHIHDISQITKEVSNNAEDAHSIVDNTMDALRQLRQSVNFFQTAKE